MTTGFFLKKKSYNWSFLILDFRVGDFHISQKRLPTPVFWPGEFRALYSPWGHKESDTTERLSLSKNPISIFRETHKKETQCYLKNWKSE